MFLIRLSMTLLFLGGLLLAGCSGPNGKQGSDEQTNLRKLVVLYGQYIAHHQGRPPANEAAFRQFIKSLSPERLSALGVGAGDIDKVFVSPRDNQPYVLRFRAATRVGTAPESAPIFAYEEIGADGTRYVAFTTTKVELTDEARFHQLVPEAAK